MFKRTSRWEVTGVCPCPRPFIPIPKPRPQRCTYRRLDCTDVFTRLTHMADFEEEKMKKQKNLKKTTEKTG